MVICCNIIKNLRGVNIIDRITVFFFNSSLLVSKCLCGKRYRHLGIGDIFLHILADSGSKLLKNQGAYGLFFFLSYFLPLWYY